MSGALTGLLPGESSGPLLRLGAPISFWGGVDPKTSRILDPRHPQHGAALAGRIVAIPALIGSSSGSTIMLELIHAGIAPAGLVLGTVDAILLIGAVSAAEMGWRAPPAAALPAAEIARLPEGPARLRVTPDLAASLDVPAPDSA